MYRYRLLTGAIGLALAGEAAAQTVHTCRIDGFDAIASARASGFQFALTDSNASTCDLENATVVVSAPQDRAARCRMRLFAGQPLSPGWSIRRVVVESSPQGAQHDLALLPNGRLLVMAVPKGVTGLFTVRKLHLRGADCALWRDAFTR